MRYHIVQDNLCGMYYVYMLCILLAIAYIMLYVYLLGKGVGGYYTLYSPITVLRKLLHNT